MLPFIFHFSLIFFAHTLYEGPHVSPFYPSQVNICVSLLTRLVNIHSFFCRYHCCSRIEVNIPVFTYLPYIIHTFFGQKTAPALFGVRLQDQINIITFSSLFHIVCQWKRGQKLGVEGICGPIVILEVPVL